MGPPEPGAASAILSEGSGRTEACEGAGGSWGGRPWGSGTHTAGRERRQGAEGGVEGEVTQQLRLGTCPVSVAAWSGVMAATQGQGGWPRPAVVCGRSGARNNTS